MTEFDVVARTVELEGDSSHPLEVSASSSDESAGIADVEIVVTNTGNRQRTVASGPPSPFGILVASERGNPDNQFTLWSERYSESELLTVDDRRIVSRRKPELFAPVEPGESISEAYTIYDRIGGLDDEPDAIAAGTYLLQDADGKTFDVGGSGVELELST